MAETCDVTEETCFLNNNTALVPKECEDSQEKSRKVVCTMGVNLFFNLPVLITMLFTGLMFSYEINFL